MSNHKTPRKKDLDFNESPTPLSLPDLNAKIAEVAYYKAEERGFVSGYELDDWLEAEQQVIYFGN